MWSLLQYCKGLTTKEIQPVLVLHLYSLYVIFQSTDINLISVYELTIRLFTTITIILEVAFVLECFLVFPRKATLFQNGSHAVDVHGYRTCIYG